MNNTVLMYSSKYGATKQYAEWLQEKLACEMYEVKDSKRVDIKNYDTFIFASGIYASGLAYVSYLKDNQESLKNKKLVLLAVGASPYDEEAMIQLKEHNFKKVSLPFTFFYARGRFIIEEMSFKDRTLCKMLRKMVAKKDEADCEPWMKALLAADVDSKNDWVEKEQLEPVLAYLKQ